MSVDCLLFHGISDEYPVASKQAGAGRIATELRKHGFTVQIIDHKGLTSRDPIWHKIIRKFVGPETLWVGFSTTITGNILGIGHQQLLDFDPDPYGQKADNDEVWINEFMDLVRQQNPDVAFIHGGPGDYDFRSYGWWKFSQGTDRHIVDFTHSLRQGRVSEKFDIEARLIKSPGFQDFSTSQIIWRPEDIIRHGQTLPIEVARGCIFKCKFCSFAYNGKSKLDYLKDSETLRDELENNYQRWGVTQYMFSDDTYNDSVEKMGILYDQVFSRLSFKIGFSCYARLDLLERQGEKGLDLFLASGVNSVFFGIESLNSPSARAVGKSGDTARLLDFLQRFKERAPEVVIGSGFIIGLPNDDRKYLDQFDQWLFGNDNPLDFWDVMTLGIRPPQKTINSEFYSDIDVNPGSYGYQIISSQDPELLKNPFNKYRANWQVNDIDLTYCSDLESSIRERSRSLDRFRAGGFLYSSYQDLGFTAEQVRNTPLKKLVVTDEQNRQRIRDYYQKILDL